MRKGWVAKPLGDVCHVIGGGTPSKRNPAFYEGDVPWATVRDMRHEVLRQTEFCITEAAIKNSSTNVIPAGNVVIATRVGLGKVCLLEQDTAINQDLRGIVPKTDNIDVRFLFRWFQSIAHRIEAEGTGATVKGVKLPFIKSLPLPLPALTEQQRIVAILDEAFEGIDTAIANTEKNLANARELFESLLGSEFLPEASEGEQVLLEDVLSEQPRNGWSPPAKNHSDAGTRVLTLSAVTGFHFRPGKFKFTSAATDPKRHYWVRNGDLLITRSNTPELVGHVAIAEALEESTIYPDLIMRMNPDPTRAITRYLYYQLRSPALRAEIKSRAHGANPTMKKISKQGVQTLPIFLPGLEVQRAVVTKLDEIQAALQSFEGVAKQKLAALAELKQSLLQKAFNGELTGNSGTSDTIAEEADFS